MKREDRLLGMGQSITRRDFLQTTLLGSGAVLLQSGGAMTPAHAQSIDTQTSRLSEVDDSWYGYGGVGDYAPSHGNTPDVVNTAHQLRDGNFNNDSAGIQDTGEFYDLVIVGAGMSGLGAAFEYTKHAAADDRCLIIENHPIFGGESKRNEFEVDGHILIGPQGANGFSVPGTPEDEAQYADFADLRYFRELDIPRDKFTYAELNNSSQDIRLAKDNYGFQFWQEDSTSVAHLGNFSAGPRWIKDPIDSEYRDMPGSDRDRADLHSWRSHSFSFSERENLNEWLDTMSYKQYLEGELGLSPAVTRHADPIMASGIGLGCDAISAYGARRLGMPVTPGLRAGSSWVRHSFPGGNDGFSRHFVKKIMPHAIAGSDNFNDIMNGEVNFSSLDVEGNPVRMRLNSTVVSVQHDGDPDTASHVNVVYSKNGQSYRLKARKVVMATGGWVNKHVVRDLPPTHLEAYQHFVHVPFLVANVAVKNWKFMERLGVGACIWNDGVFGNACNVRLPMTVGSYQPVIDPGKPTIVTFYVPFIYPGMPNTAQGIRGRAELFATSYAEYEKNIRLQMVELFGGTGFDPVNDIAGIVLNRWGHAYVAPQPGFFFGRDGNPTPRDIIRQSFGRIAIAHSELGGIQHWGPAADEGKRAVEQLSAIG